MISRTGKGNIPINKAFAKKIENGIIFQELPHVEHNGKMVPLFTSVPPTHCTICANTLNINEHYTRYILSSYGVIECPVTYWECSNPACRKHHHDTIIGVTGSANYSDEYLQKQKIVRYEGKCSLWNTRTVGETFTAGMTDTSGRAPSPSTLWRYEQIQGKISANELSSQAIDFDGTLYIDGYWVKAGWRKFIEAQMGRKFTNREWKRMRYKIIYVAATEEKVVLDFQITNLQPSYLELVPLLNRIKNRIPEGKIVRMVSDEDNAIIDSVRYVFPDILHSFCVFHQLKNITKRYLEEFEKLENIPPYEIKIYELAKGLILSETAIESTACMRNIETFISNLNESLSKASCKVIEYISEVYVRNIKILNKGFTPETNNVMEQLFSLIDDFVRQARSFKIRDGMANFFYNLFADMNKKCYNTCAWRGFSPVQRAKIKCG